MKRLFDMLVAGVLLLTLSPVLLVVALLVRVRLGTPVLFRQERPGLHEQLFTLLKFRTMTSECDAQGKLKPDTERLTDFGRFLRRSSLDELPELVNVLRGEMSLVGPRPLIPRYLPYFTARERLRFTVRPGITGLAQVGGRNQVSWDERLALDVRYVATRSFWGDLRILWMTAIAVVRQSGAEADPSTIMADLDAERGERARPK